MFRHELVLQHLLRATPEGGRAPELPEALPERTVEISVVPETAQPARIERANERHPLSYFFPIGCAAPKATRQQVMPDDHSVAVPPLPIPNRTVKRLHADDSADYPCESR